MRRIIVILAVVGIALLPLSGAAGGPVSATWGVNRLDSFVRGADGALWHSYFNGAWHWESRGGSPTSDASVTSWGPGRLDVFARFSDRGLWHDWLDAGFWHGWEPLGGQLAGSPSAVSDAAGNIDVFVEGTDGRLWRDSYRPATGWTWSGLGGVLAADPAAVAPGPNSIQAYIDGADQALWQWDSQTGWVSLGGRVLGPASVASSGGFVDVYVEGADQALWHWTTSAGGWQPSLGGQLGAPPTAVSWGSNRADVFVRGTDGGVWHWNNGALTIAAGWEALGGQIVFRPGAATWGSPRLDVFVQGTDNALWHASTMGSGWSWENLGGILLGYTPPPSPQQGTCGAPTNPWRYNFCDSNFGKYIHSPASNFCVYFSCIASFWQFPNGYVTECVDGRYSHSGGISGACSSHGGEWRALWAA